MFMLYIKKRFIGEKSPLCAITLDKLKMNATKFFSNTYLFWSQNKYNNFDHSFSKKNMIKLLVFQELLHIGKGLLKKMFAMPNVHIGKRLPVTLSKVQFV